MLFMMAFHTTVFAFLLLVYAGTYTLAANRSFIIDYERNTFLKDGEPFRYISGSIHYSRVHPYYWRDRLLKMYAAGLNAIQFYIPWNVHETQSGVYNFTGLNDVEGFIKEAQDVGLLVIIRAGPYICGEWEFGGLPAWLITEYPNDIWRTSDPGYIKFVDRWLSVLLPRIKPLLYVNGGPVISVQLENEYGSWFACDYSYTRFLRQKAASILGSENVIFFTTDGAGDGFLRCGSLEGCYTTVDFGVTYDPAASFKPQRDFQPKGPLVNSEFYTGWLDHWGSPHSIVKTDPLAKSLDLLLAYGANINMYMFEGGTNFGYWNGANYGPYNPVPTSYDYDGPLTEAGDITHKYIALRQIISKHRKLPQMKIPPNVPKFGYGDVKMRFVSTVQDALTVLCPSGPIFSDYPKTMEQIQHFYGFILYRHNIKVGGTNIQLNVPGVRDRGYIMINTLPMGVLVRERTTAINLTLSIGDVLDILVENQGRIGFGSQMNYNRKGIIENVTLGSDIVEGWEIYPIDLDNISPQLLNKIPQRQNIPKSNGLTTPSIFMGEIPIPVSLDHPYDSYLDMTLWTKGQAYINSFNLGRYWPHKGPQVRLYVPKPVFKTPPMKNYITMFELESSPCDMEKTCLVQFVPFPLINGNVSASLKNGEFDGNVKVIDEHFKWNLWH